MSILKLLRAERLQPPLALDVRLGDVGVGRPTCNCKLRKPQIKGVEFISLPYEFLGRDFLIVIVVGVFSTSRLRCREVEKFLWLLCR